jgi:hypothetical protein
MAETTIRRRVATACRAEATTTTVPGLRVPLRGHGPTLIPTINTIPIADSASSSVPCFETRRAASQPAFPVQMSAFIFIRQAVSTVVRWPLLAEHIGRKPAPRLGNPEPRSTAQGRPRSSVSPVVSPYSPKSRTRREPRPCKSLFQTGVRHDQFAVVEHVVTGQGVDEPLDLIDESPRLVGQLRQALRQTVRHLDNASVQELSNFIS